MSVNEDHIPSVQFLAARFARMNSQESFQSSSPSPPVERHAKKTGEISPADRIKNGVENAHPVAVNKSEPLVSQLKPNKDASQERISEKDATDHKPPRIADIIDKLRKDPTKNVIAAELAPSAESQSPTISSVSTYREEKLESADNKSTPERIKRMMNEKKCSPDNDSNDTHPPTSPKPAIPYRTRPILTASPSRTSLSQLCSPPPLPLPTYTPKPEQSPSPTVAEEPEEDMETPMSVANLKETWERLAQQHGWMAGGWIADVEAEIVHDDPIGTLVESTVEQPEEFQTLAHTELVEQAEEIQASTHTDMFQTLTSGPVPHNNCDMIVCGVKTLTVNGTKVHEIELGCQQCASSFVLRAAHECSNTNPDELAYQERGLEWLRDERSDYINIIC